MKFVRVPRFIIYCRLNRLTVMSSNFVMSTMYVSGQGLAGAGPSECLVLRLASGVDPLRACDPTRS